MACPTELLTVDKNSFNDCVSGLDCFLIRVGDVLRTNIFFVVSSLSPVKFFVPCSTGYKFFSGSVPSSAQPAGPATTPAREDEDSAVQEKEESQQYPLDSREAENSAELGASDNEEEPGDTDEYVTDEASLQSVISDIW